MVRIVRKDVVNKMARSPYEILGVREGADFETAKKAYRELVRKYHPDQYVNHPLSDLAEEKLKEINSAYDELSNRENARKNGNKQSGNQNPNKQNSNYQNTGYKDPGTDMSNIRQLIFSNRIQEADAALNNINERSAEWYYLKGLVFSRMGWYNEAMSSFETAVNIEPGNFEYRQALNKMNTGNKSYRNNGYNMRGNNSPDMCQMCQCLICTDCCCECAGGDLINCM